MAKKRENRYHNVKDMVTDLQVFMRSSESRQFNANVAAAKDASMQNFKKVQTSKVKRKAVQKNKKQTPIHSRMPIYISSICAFLLAIAVLLITTKPKDNQKNNKGSNKRKLVNETHINNDKNEKSRLPLGKKNLAN